MSKEKIVSFYLDHLLDQGKPPVSVYKLCKETGISEADFYRQYSSLRDIERQYARDLVQKTIEAVSGDEEYSQYSVREKLLAFYFTFFEQALSFRSYLQVRFANVQPGREPGFLKDFKRTFLDFAQELIQQGYEEKSVVQRPLVSGRFKDILYAQFLLLIRYYVEDDSQQFQDTDAYIEKTVKLFFELAGTTPIDTAFDLARFFIQNRRHA